MKVLTNTTMALLAFVIISGQHSTMTVTSGKNCVHVQIDEITDTVTITNSWLAANGVIWNEGILNVAPGKHDKHNGHTFYCPWGRLGANASMAMFPATHVKIVTDDGGDSGWLLLDCD